MKIVLAYLCHYSDRNDFFLTLLPYGLTSIAAYLESKGLDVTLANLSQYGYKKGAAKILNEKPDILGVSIFSFNRIESLKLIDTVRREAPDITIVAGGPFATDCSKELLRRSPGIHYIVQGDGEEALYHLIMNIKEGSAPDPIVQGSRIHNLDSLPFASSFSGLSIGVDEYTQYSFIISSRGCPNNCVYCSSPSFWGRLVAYRSAEHLVDEIEQLYRERGILYFSIRDDNFVLKKRRVLEFTNLLQKRGLYVLWNCQARVDSVDLEMLVAMKNAGLEHIQYGIESGSERILFFMNKQLSMSAMREAARITREAGINLSIYLMAGMKGEKDEDIQKTIALIHELKPADGIVSPVALYPGTSLYNEMKEKGEIADAIWFERKSSGIYMREDAVSSKRVATLARELQKAGIKYQYQGKDFAAHRKVAGEKCWVTDILSGDFYFFHKKFVEAERAYQRVIKNFPDNIWGHLKMGQLAREWGDAAAAIQFFTTATQVNPKYYGSWIELARLAMEAGKRDEAKGYAMHAHQLNHYDTTVNNLVFHR